MIPSPSNIPTLYDASDVSKSGGARLAFEYPWEKWTLFLHPLNVIWRTSVLQSRTGRGSISRHGKTIVALPPSRPLARGQSDARILLTNVFRVLANALRQSSVVVNKRTRPWSNSSSAMP